jgi:hypothetical protein
VRYPFAIAAVIMATMPAMLAAQSQAPLPAGGTTSTTPVAGTTPQVGTITPVLGQSRLTGDQIAAWFLKQGIRPNLPITINELARIFVDEGDAQNVRGDIAFVQSILETGWFRYEGSMVKPGDNNYSGLGACDSCSRGNIFATPQEGVRAQIQHLWAYADPNADPRKTARPLADRRFTYVSPYGKAPTWEAMGNGNWATGGGYTEKILGLYASMLRFNGLEPQQGKLRTVASGTSPSGPLKVVVTRAGAVRLGALPGRSGTIGAATTAFGSPATKRASYGTCHVSWSSLGAVMTFAPSGGSTCGDASRMRAAVLTGPQWVTAKGLKPGDRISRMRALYGKKAGAVLVKGRNGARLTARTGEGVVKALVVSVPKPR